jgi:transposase
MHLERVQSGESKLQACRHISGLLDINPVTIRNWVEAQERSGQRPVETKAGGTPEVRELTREVAELRRANVILKTASASFGAAELDRRLRPRRCMGCSKFIHRTAACGIRAA